MIRCADNIRLKILTYMCIHVYVKKQIGGGTRVVHGMAWRKTCEGYNSKYSVLSSKRASVWY